MATIKQDTTKASNKPLTALEVIAKVAQAQIEQEYGSVSKAIEKLA